jgi:lysophospholipase L1-like esterase
MPITGKNKEMIDPRLYSRFTTTVARLPDEYGATFINMDDATYDPARDYMDSVHLSDEGAPKLINRLVDKIKPQIVASEPALRP